MAGHECYHCKQWVEAGKAHDCWTTTEQALTGDLSEDLRDAWERLRETAVSFGDQRIYASHNSIMFSRKSCYFFVRPKKTFLEVCVFLPRPVKAPQIRRVVPSSKTKLVHMLRVTHRDEVEAPITDWLREAYDFAGMVSPAGRSQLSTTRAKPRRKTAGPLVRKAAPKSKSKSTARKTSPKKKRR